MNAFKELRAKQKSRDSIKTAGAMKLHRIVDLEADDYCAPEGCYVAPHPMDENQGDGPIKKTPRPPKPKRSGWQLSAYAVLAFALVMLAIHFGAPR